MHKKRKHSPGFPRSGGHFAPNTISSAPPRALTFFKRPEPAAGQPKCEISTDQAIGSHIAKTAGSVESHPLPTTIEELKNSIGRYLKIGSILYEVLVIDNDAVIVRRKIPTRIAGTRVIGKLALRFERVLRLGGYFTQGGAPTLTDPDAGGLCASISGSELPGRSG